MSRVVYLVALLVVVVYGRAAGQHPATPDARAASRSAETGAVAGVGDRVRIRFSPAEHTALIGTVAAMDSAGLLLSPEGGGESVMIARDSLRSLELSRGVHSRTGRGAGIGLLAGAAAGAVIGFASGSDQPGWFSLSAEEKATLGAIGGAVVGGVVGLIVGASTRHERWAEVPIQQVAVRIRPGPRGAILALAVSF